MCQSVVPEYRMRVCGGDLCRVHKVDEFISIDELVEVTKVFAGLTIELCAY